MLHVHADREQVIDVVECLSWRELRERDLRVETLTDFIRKEYASTKVRTGEFIPCGTRNRAVEAKCFSGAARELSRGAGEGGLGPHHGDQVYEVRAGAAVIVDHV